MAQPKDISICQKTFIKKSGTSYQRKDVLGKGNFGIVFLGSHKGKQVAVKRLDLHRLDPEDREVNLHMKLEHDNVLKILSVDEDDEFRQFFLSEITLCYVRFHLKTIMPLTDTSYWNYVRERLAM